MDFLGNLELLGLIPRAQDHLAGTAVDTPASQVPESPQITTAV